MKWILHAALGMGVLASWPGPVHAAEPERDQTIEITVDAVDLSDTRAELPVVVETELERLLIEQDDLPPGVFAAEDRSVLVELRPGPIPGGDDVLIRAVVRLDGQTLADSPTETCLACSDETVAEKALMLLEPLLPKLPGPAVPAPPPPTLAVDETPPELDQGLEPVGTQRRLLIPGVTLVGAGGLGLGIGIGLIATNERVVSSPDALELEVVKYRAPGIALAVVGGTAVVAGAVLLALSHRKKAASFITGLSHF